MGMYSGGLLTFLRAQKFAQEFFLGVLAHCYNGVNEAHLPHSAISRRPPPYISIDCDGIAPMTQGL